MEDYGPREARLIAWAQNGLCDFLLGYGYHQVDTPILEETDLLLRKSGGELASKMYTFIDPGGHRVSLRPEFTSSIARAYLGSVDLETLPVRWAYSGPVFRYDSEEPEYRQFTQVGAELIGAAGPWADAEVLAVSSKGLSRLGLTKHTLIVGHLGLVSALLDTFDLSGRARLFLLANMAKLRNGHDGAKEVRELAEQLGLLVTHIDTNDSGDVVSNEAANALFERHAQSPTPTIGVRTMEEIRDRFLSKQNHIIDKGSFDSAIDLLSKILQIKGDRRIALQKIRAMARSREARDLIDEFEITLNALSEYQLGISINVDFGLVRDIAYYTGLVFEIRHDSEEGVQLGGGGRYDGLIRALGGPDRTPTIGFACSAERIVRALAEECVDLESIVDTSGMVMVRPENSAAMSAAVKEAERLRGDGKVVQLDTGTRSMKDCITQARERGIKLILTLGSDGSVRPSNVK